MRILVTIANHGVGRPEMVRRLIDEYRSLPHDVSVVLLSDRDKPSSPGVEVAVGAPTDNPYSLPFAHRKIFAQRRDDFDLFIYSEDDTLFTAANLSRWMDLNAKLPSNLVPGFIRHEENSAGLRTYPSFHSGFHWQTETIAEYRGEVVASYSNLHSALYAIDRPALDIALASGNFDVEPHSGRYDMLVMAGAGPFIDCGLERVLPLSRTRELSLHHLPNDYVGVLGIDDDGLQRQIDACVDVYAGRRIAGQLFPVATKLQEFTYDKMIYEQVLEAIPSAITGSPRILSVGSGMGLLESRLSEDHEVVCIPVDAIAQAEIEHLGMASTPPDLTSALDQLHGQRFDAVVLSNVLHHVADPRSWLNALTPLAPEGVMIASVPEMLSYRARAIGQSVTGRLGLRGHKMSKLQPPPKAPYAQTHLHRSGRRWIRGLLQGAGITQLVVTREQERPRIIDSRYRMSKLSRLLPSHVVASGKVTSRPN